MKSIAGRRVLGQIIEKRQERIEHIPTVFKASSGRTKLPKKHAVKPVPDISITFPTEVNLQGEGRGG